MKIRIVKASDPGNWYANKIGEVFEVSGEGFLGGYKVRHNGDDDRYHVAKGNFEIVNEEANEMPNGIIEQMQAEIAELKTKVAALEGSGKISIREAGENTFRAVVEGKSLLPKSPQQIRDEIVEKAKADVERLSIRGNGGYIGAFAAKIDFIVNSEKRTVVALPKDFDGDVLAKGIAKADPSDCFNVHLGKAIALRRALGLEVPAEYYNAPAPTEVRVGDVVRGDYTGESITVNKVSSNGYIHGKYFDGGNAFTAHYEIIDDSREV